MIKLGICRRGRRQVRALRLEAAHKGWWPFSYGLLEQLADDYQFEDEALLERLYRSMASGAHSFKITRRHRFDELDDKLVPDITRRFSGAERVAVHDVAVSNGITSLELFRKLSGECHVDFVASDKFNSIWIVDGPPGAWRVVFDDEETPLQIIGYGFVLSAKRKELWRYPINRMAQWWLMKTILPIRRSHLEKARNEEPRINGSLESKVRPVLLFHPECVRQAKIDRSFALRQYDLTQPPWRRFHVIRVMNALTPEHMDESNLRAGIHSCMSGLYDGGLLVLGRSPEERDEGTRVTVYERVGGSLRAAWSMNGGYEWPELVSRGA